MAQDPLAMVYGGQIGQGQAQVFDTSGIAKQVIAQNKEKDKVFLDSIIDLDVSKVWNQDLPEYNEMWGKYRTFVSDNYKALSNPSRNVDKWSEKKRMEQAAAAKEAALKAKIARAKIRELRLKEIREREKREAEKRAARFKSILKLKAASEKAAK